MRHSAMTHVICLLLFPLLLTNNSPSLAYTVIATETARGEYENGTFTPGPPEFRFRIEVDEEAHRAKLTETTRLKNNRLIETPIEYAIFSVEDGSEVSSMLYRSENRKGQKILTLIGKPGSLATEVIYIGETFFEYCKIASGRLYLATGKLDRPLPVGDEEVIHRSEKLEELSR